MTPALDIQEAELREQVESLLNEWGMNVAWTNSFTDDTPKRLLSADIVSLIREREVRARREFAEEVKKLQIPVNIRDLELYGERYHPSYIREYVDTILTRLENKEE